MIVENLRQFGMNDKEISVYLSLVSLGPSPVRQIASKAGVNRGTTYDILKKLIELGIVSQHHQEGKKQHFFAEPPQKLLHAINEKRHSLDILHSEVEKSLPELVSLYDKGGAKPIVKYFEGPKGVKAILADILETMKSKKQKIYYVYSSADIRDHLYKPYPDYNKDRIKNDIKVKAIAIGRGGELAGLDERKWLSHEDSSPTYVLIYGEKIAMITLDMANLPVGVIIENPGLYATQKMIFEKLWDSLKS